MRPTNYHMKLSDVNGQLGGVHGISFTSSYTKDIARNVVLVG